MRGGISFIAIRPSTPVNLYNLMLNATMIKIDYNYDDQDHYHVDHNDDDQNHDHLYIIGRFCLSVCL